MIYISRFWCRLFLVFICRSVLYTGRGFDPEDIEAALEPITAKTVREVCMKYIYDKCPAVVGYGQYKVFWKYENRISRFLLCWCWKLKSQNLAAVGRKMWLFFVSCTIYLCPFTHMQELSRLQCRYRNSVLQYNAQIAHIFDWHLIDLQHWCGQLSLMSV